MNPATKLFTIDQIFASRGRQDNAFVTFDNVVCGRAVHGEHGWTNMARTLTQQQQEAFVQFFGKGCQPKTVQAIREAAANPAMLKSSSMFARIQIYRDRVEYVCGQSWPEEMKLIRSLLKKRK